MKKYKTIKFLFALCLVFQTLTLVCYGTSNRFCGGSFDGFSAFSFLQSESGNFVSSNKCFSGGSFDGSSASSFIQSESGNFVSSNKCYGGGSFDGYAASSFVQSEGGSFVSSNKCYGGGSFDGYAAFSFVQSEGGNFVSTNKCFSGGSFDGYAASSFIQSEGGNFVSTNKCYSGGSYDGYDNSYFEYPVPFVEITNAPDFRLFSQTTAEISGTNNSNVLGQLGWLNNRFSGLTNWFDQGFSVEVNGLAEGSNVITVIGINSLGIYGRDSVIIYRETFEDVHPFIQITNAPAIVAFNVSSAEISGTNLNIAGDITWTNSLTGDSGSIPVSGVWFQVSGINLEHGDNLITIFGTNIYGMFTNDFVNINRETWEEVHPFIKITNAPSEVAYNISSAEISGTNLNIAGNLGIVNDQHPETTNFFVPGFFTTISNLEFGDNLIEIFGTNVYGHSTNDFVTIHRETFAEVHPFIDITNENATVTYSVTAYTIGGTNNANVVSDIMWTNSLTGDSGTSPISNFEFQISNFSLGVGENIITVSGTNIYGQSTNDVVSIQRKTLIESEPHIATNALIFPFKNSPPVLGGVLEEWGGENSGAVLLAPFPTNIIWDTEKITDDLDGTNLTITKITVHLAETTNEVATVTNDVSNLLGEISWLVPENLIAGDTNYVIKFEVVDSSSLTNSRIFWDNEFTIVPEGGILWIIGILECWIIGRKFKFSKI